MSLPTAELINQVAEWRRKAADGTITLEEQKQAVLILRQNRTSALTASAPKKGGGGKKKAPVNADALLGELDGL
jgi:hypothetical protein